MQYSRWGHMRLEQSRRITSLHLLATLPLMHPSILYELQVHLAQSCPAPHPTQVQDFTGDRPDEARGGCAPRGHGQSPSPAPGGSCCGTGDPGDPGRPALAVVLTRDERGLFANGGPGRKQNRPRSYSFTRELETGLPYQTRNVSNAR